MSVRKAVLPVAGFGTRFLPVTKAVPKEMLPIVDRPCIEYVVAEAIEAGITEFVFVTARGKGAMEAYFDRSPALEAQLEAAGKRDMLAEVRRVASMATVVSVRQQEQRGLGHAVLTAAPAVGDADFAVLLPDDIVDADSPCIGQLLRVHADVGGGVVVALKPVPREDTRRYGICAGPMVADDRMRVEAMVEKPSPEKAPSNLSIVGRYVLPGEIFEILRGTEPGAGGEIQLTDALAVLAARGRAHGHVFTGRHFDTGNPLGLLDAQLHYTVKRFGDDARARIRAYAE
jgi:UTP--glucose-1-phosphate uridylyltransferase